MNWWLKNKSTSNKLFPKTITCLWNAFALLILILSPLTNGSKDSKTIKQCQSFISIRKLVILKILSLLMKIQKNSMKLKRHIPTTKTKRPNKTTMKVSEDFGLRTKKQTTEKSQDGKYCSLNKVSKNGLKKSLKPVNSESKWTHCLDSIIMLTICQLKTLTIYKPTFKLVFWEKSQWVSKKNKLILWCKKWITLLLNYKIKFFSKNISDKTQMLKKCSRNHWNLISQEPKLYHKLEELVSKEIRK